MSRKQAPPEPSWGFSFNSVRAWVPWTLGLAGGIQQMFIADQPSPLLVGMVLTLLGLPGAVQLAASLWNSPVFGSASSSLPSSVPDSTSLEDEKNDSHQG